MLELQKEFGADKVTEDNIVESADGKKWTVTIDGATAELEAGSTIAQNPQEPEIPSLPKDTGTKPYLPSDSFSQVDGTDLNTGLVITDEVDEEGNSIGNEYVWIEVPNNLQGETKFGPTYPTGTTSTDYTAIKTALISYTETLLNGSDYKTSRMSCLDEWYDSNNKTAEESSNTGDTAGCGLTSSRYTELYNAMLTSIFEHGGFWIGKYEAGMLGDKGRSDVNVSTDDVIPLAKKDLIPIFYVTCSKAQQIATRVPNKGSYNSSLMFGLQWDCVLKYLQNKGVSVSDLISNSTGWGNYTDTSNATLRGGRYTQFANLNQGYNQTFNKTWYAYTENLGNIINNKILNNVSMPQTVLLTTGALPSNMAKQNIYDLAGNVLEFTLEHSDSIQANGVACPCSARGGTFGTTGTNNPVSTRSSLLTDTGNYDYGFRVCLY